MTEDFNSYSDGALNLQGPWAGDANYLVQGVTKYEGTKGIKVTAAGTLFMSASVTHTPSAFLSVMLRKDVSTGGATTMQRVVVDDTMSREVACFQMYGPNISYISNMIPVVLVPNYSLATWYKIDAVWRDQPDFKTKYRVNDGAWTDWVTRPYITSVDVAHRLHLVCDSLSGGAEAYFDYVT